MKAYLDNNVVSAIARDDTPAESDAIDRLLAASDAGAIDLVTSEVTFEEIKRYSGTQRKVVERIFRLLEKVKIVKWDKLLGMHSYGDSLTWITSPLIQNDPLYDALLSVGLSSTDAQHLFVASRSDCGTFLTCDGGVLTRAADIQRLSGVEVQKPSVLVLNNKW